MEDTVMTGYGAGADAGLPPAGAAAALHGKRSRRALRPATGGGSRAEMRWALLAALIILNWIAVLALSYVAQYWPIERALQLEHGADARYHVLVYGGQLSEAALADLRAGLPEGVELMRGDAGAVYGYAYADSAWSCALSELRLRGILGAAAHADRWASATGATRVRPGMAIPADRRWSANAALTDIARRLLDGCGDAARTLYADANCASARGAAYHAAVRAGDALIYMLAYGYIPVDY